MKKILWLITVAMMTMMLALSCEKKNQGGKDDPDPDPEPEPTAYADFIFEYSVVLPADAAQYSYVELDLASVKCDGKNVWECFGLSSQDELITALGTLSGGAQSGHTINFIGFDVSTEYVVETPSTTNAFGHWHTAAGDCCSWGDDAYLFAESGFEGNLVMNIGQFPGRLVEGESYKFIEGMQNDDVSVAFEITVSVEAQSTWSYTTTVSVGGSEAEAEFDIDAIAKYLGVNDKKGLMDALTAGTVYMVGINPDGSQYLGSDGKPNYSQINDAGAKGIFFSAAGENTVWASGTDHYYATMYWGNDPDAGDYLEFWVTPFAADEEQITGEPTIYQWDLVGADKTAHLLFYVVLETAVPWAEYTAEEGFVYNIRMMVDNGYKGLAIDIDDDALKAALGVDDLAAGISAEEPTVIVWGLNADGSEATNEDGSRWNSGERPFGHWFDTTGNVCTWGEGAAMCFNVKADDGVYVMTCQFPESAAVGNEYVMKQKFVAGDKSQIVTYKVTIVEEL